MKVVLSTVLDFESLEGLAAACAECIEKNQKRVIIINVTININTKILNV